jgi:hypothetical protein
VNIQTLTHVYGNTKPKCLLRQYFVWQYANTMRPATIQEEEAVKSYPKHFMLEWIIMLTMLGQAELSVSKALQALKVEDFMMLEKKVEYQSEQLRMDGN